MNSLEPELRFTKEVAEDFQSKTLPTLDYEIWTDWVEEDQTPGAEQPTQDPDNEHQEQAQGGGGERTGDPQPDQRDPPKGRGKHQVIRYRFYQKPVASKYFTLKKSAMSFNQRRAMLAQELVRRLLNTSRDLPKEDKNQIVKEFIVKVRRSGYTRSQTRDIVVS